MMFKTLRTIVVMAAPLLLGPMPSVGAEAAAPRWTASTPERPVVAGSAVRETEWAQTRPPGGPFDRISLHRYRTVGQPVATLLYLPGTNMNGVAALTDEAHNLWLYLAARGIEVYTLDYRTHAVPADAPASALQALRQWTSAVFVDDITAALDFVRATSGRDKVHVAGFSRGAFLAYALASVRPEQLAGLIVFDGYFKRHTPPATFDRAAGLAKLESSGAWASDVGGSRGWPARQQLMAAVATNPDGPPAEPAFRSIGEQLTQVLQKAWGPGALANPAGGISKPQVLARLLQGYDRYYPAIQDVEGTQIASVADDPASALDDRWGQMTLPVLLFSSTGMGGDWMLNNIHSAARSGSRDVSIRVLARYGHLDVLVSETAVDEVYEPTLQWILRRSGGGR